MKIFIDETKQHLLFHFGGSKHITACAKIWKKGSESGISTHCSSGLTGIDHLAYGMPEVQNLTVTADLRSLSLLPSGSVPWSWDLNHFF